MSNAKIRVKVGEVEVDYEGEAAFIENGLLDLLGKVQKISPHKPNLGGGMDQHSGGTPILPGGIKMTTKTIAAKLSAKTGADVAQSAIACLALMKSAATFKRSDILSEMKTATGIYKPTMSGNLSGILSSLINDIIIETAPEVYALTPAGESKLRHSLGI